MPLKKTSRRLVAQTSSVVAVTVSFIAVAITLTYLVTRVVSTMVHSANEIDDARALHMTRTVITELSEKLGMTVQDNAVWDDAYAAIGSPAAVAWAYENWGKTSEDYSLYDGAVVTGPDGGTISAYAKGQPFQPFAHFGDAFARQIEVAAAPGQDPMVNFFKTKHGVALLASQALQPFETGANLPRLSVLTLYKELTPDILDALAKEHELEGLRFQSTPEPGLLSAPIEDVNGAAIAYLVWPSRAPGNTIFNEVYPDVAAATGILVLFLVAVLLAGASEVRRLRHLVGAARFEATHDALSGLLNRHGILTLLGRMEGNGPAVSLYLIDLNGFKAVNDAWGHAVGDELICMVANALRACHPEIQAAGRLGGDEFALVQVGPAGHGEVTDAILGLFGRPFRIDGRTIEVNASIGIAASPGNGGPLELLRRADMALYRAKEKGKGQAVAYDVQLDRERERIGEMEIDLKRAIEDGTIQPVFQPLVCASTGATIGLEALARWSNAGSSISPDVFIPLAEKSGLIDALGAHMLRTSIDCAKNWPGLALSVNVSPVQLCNPDFATLVIAVLAEAQFDPRRLTLEITEGVLISSPEQARRSIDQLHHAGIKFALDDFGCGYASIGALREFGFDRMKIDRSLVSGLEENANGIEVLRATVALATALDIPVTAEGIENIHQAEVLRDTGCDQFQGYLMGKPMSARDISRTLTETGSAA